MQDTFLAESSKPFQRHKRKHDLAPPFSRSIIWATAVLLCFAAALHYAKGQGLTHFVQQSDKSVTIDYFPAHVSATSNERDALMESVALALPPGARAIVTVLETEFEKQSAGKGLVSSPSMTTPPARMRARDTFRYQEYAEIEIEPGLFDGKGKLIARYGRIRLRVDFIGGDVSRGKYIADPHLEQTYRLLFANYEQGKSWRIYLSAERQSLQRVRAGTDFRGKLKTAQRGIQAVPFEKLALAVPTLSGALISQIQLHYKGEEISYYAKSDNNLFDTGDTLYFYGMPLKDATGIADEYSDTSVYWISVSSLNARTVPAAPTPPAVPPAETLFAYHEKNILEQDLMYHPGNTSPENNHTDKMPGEGWYWRSMNAGAQFSIPFTTLNKVSAASDSVRLTFRFNSTVKSFNPIDHKVEVQLNGHKADTIEFKGYQQIEALVSAPSSWLNEGANTILLRSLTTATSVNQFLVDRVIVEYPRSFVALNGSIEFVPQYSGTRRAFTLPISGFPDSTIFAAELDSLGGMTRLLNGNATQAGELFTYTISDTVTSGRRHVISSRAGLRDSAIALPYTYAGILSSSHQADYLVITSTELLGAAQALADYRREKGIGSTAVINVQDIYDELSYGHYAPPALKQFLEQVDYSWAAPAPAYVVLLGDASWDHRNRLGVVSRNFVPTYGYPVSDNRLVTKPSQPYLPQKFVGRLPFSSNDTALAFVQAMRQYEQEPLGPWNKRFLFMAFGWDSTESARFSGFWQNVGAQYISPSPLGSNVSILSRTSTSVVDFDKIQEGKELVNEGGIWISYYGHAASELWGNGISQAHQLKNKYGRRHVISDISCGTARFAEPNFISFGERFFPAGDGAGIAYMGSSALGYESPLRVIGEALFRAVGPDSMRRIGQIHHAGLARLWANGTGSLTNQFTLDQFVLLGDPALAIAIPQTPDYLLTADSVFTTPAQPSEGDSTVVLNIPLYNWGTRGRDSVTLEVKHTPPGETQTTHQFKIAPFSYHTVAQFVIRQSLGAGIHSFALSVNPEQSTPEYSYTNNSGTYSFLAASQRMLKIYPQYFAGMHRDSVRFIFQNPGSGSAAGDAVIVEIDTADGFTAPVASIRIPFSQTGAATTVHVPPGTLAPNTTYHWRARIENVQDTRQSYSGIFTTTPTALFWSQQTQKSLSSNAMENLMPTQYGWRLLDRLMIIEAFSAGFQDGVRASVTVDGVDISSGFADRGYNVAVLNEENGNLESFGAFNIYMDPPFDSTKAEPLIAFMDTIPQGRIVVVAIADEGWVNKTEAVCKQMESIGSAQIRTVQWRDSWAIIGYKGAPIGSVPEKRTARGTGPVSIADTVLIAPRTGLMSAGVVGPADGWRSMTMQIDSLSADKNIAIQIERRHKKGFIDTVQVAAASAIDLSALLSDSVQTIIPSALFSVSEKGTSPYFGGWSVTADEPYELAIDRRRSVTVRDSAKEGYPVAIGYAVSNIGVTHAPSATLLMIRKSSPDDTLASITVPALPADSVFAGQITVPTLGIRGNWQVEYYLSTSETRTEQYTENNLHRTSFAVLTDSAAASDVPPYTLTFDGKAIWEGDYVSARPRIEIQFSDTIPSRFMSPSTVRLELNGRQVQLGGDADSLLAVTTSGSGAEEARITYIPRLGNGMHTLAMNVATGLSPAEVELFEIRFRSESGSMLRDVAAYPNPFRDRTYFTFNAVGAELPESVQLKIFTISGRLIKTIAISGAEVGFGFNRFEWDGRDDDGDEVANGIYFYKLIVKYKETTTEEIFKLARVR